jgi:hypothetical protein
VLAALVAAAMAVASCSSGSGSGARAAGPPAPAAEPAAKPAAEHAAVAPARTSNSAAGVTSASTIEENRKAGTDSWQLRGPGSGFIAGFADTTDARAGDQVRLFVSTDAPDFEVVAYRMGWYGGHGGREVWHSAALPGVRQPECPVAKPTNMVSCHNWSPSVTIPMSPEFVPGDYLLKLVGHANQQSYVQLTVWEPDSTATYLVMNRALVEQGWNTYGGYSFYEGKGPCTFDSSPYPPCNRARVVSFDRPYDGNGSSDFLTNEYPLVAFAEELGLDVSYCTDICISRHPEIVQRHKALIGLDHDETWTNSERVAVVDAFHQGVNVAFLGAATLVRHARLEPSPLGPDRQEVDYRNPQEDPLNGHGDPMEVTGNTWSAPPTNWDAASFVGQIYSGYIVPDKPSVPLVVFDPSAWIFKGMGLARGDAIPAMINSDIDHIDPKGPMPRNIQVFGHSPVPLTDAYTNQGKWGGYTYSDMTYYTDGTTGAGVFDSGDNDWVATLLPCPGGDGPHCPRLAVRQMTANLLQLFGEGPAGRLQPSVPNWESVTPLGS